MSTPRGIILGGGGNLPIAGVQQPAAPTYTPLGDDVNAILGIQSIRPEDEDYVTRWRREHLPEGWNRFWTKFNAGVGEGFLAPLEFIDPIRRYTEELKQSSDAAGGGAVNSIGQGVGFLLGFLVPAGIAGKAAGYGVRGLQTVSGLRLIQAAEGGAELTRLGVLTQGALAGGLLTVGMEPGEGSTRIGNVGLGMVAGGVGDVVLQSAWKLITGGSIFRRGVSNATRRGAEEILESGVTTTQTAEDLARSATLMDRLTAPTNPHGDAIGDSVAARKTGLLLGMDELGLSGLDEGQFRIVPTLTGKVDEIKSTMQNIEGVEYTIASRTSAEGHVTHDLLVGRVGTKLPAELVDSFKKHGFIPGQEAVWAGRRFILSGPSKNPEYVMGIAADATRRLTPIPRSELLLGDIVRPIVKAADKIPDANGMWLGFVKEHGPFPSSLVDEATGVSRGFDDAFETFTTGKKLTPGAKEQLRLYFAQRQNQLLREVDDGELGRVLDNVTSAVGRGVTHPEGNIEELASQRGLIVKRIPVPSAKKKGKIRWGQALVDVDSGQAYGPFETKGLTRKFLQTFNRADMPKLDPGSPLADGAAGMPGRASLVTQLLNQAELSNANIPWSVTLFNKVTPYLHFVRRANDALIKEVGEAAPDIYGKYADMLAQMAVQRSESSGWLERLTKIRGGGIFKSSRVRVDKLEDLADLLEVGAPGSAEWTALAAERGINAAEQATVKELRQFYDDIFKVAVESDTIDITAEDFIQNYMPHIMRRGHDNWVESFTRMHGRKPSTKVRDFVHEFERTGELTRYEKDPFVVAYRYTDSLFFKRHVSDAWSELRKVIDDIPEQRADTRAPNFGLIQLKQTLLDQMSMLRGNPIATDYTTRAAMQSVGKQLNLHIDEKTLDRTISTLIGANYGAFMGWRPALAVRNLSQIIMTGLPLLGPKYLSYGMRAAVREGAESELHQMGVIAKGAYGLPFQDALYYDTVRRGVQEAGRGATLSKAAAKVGQAVRLGTQKSLWMQGVTDSINRRVVYYGAKQRMLDSVSRWAREGWTKEVFDAKSGLSASGPSVTKSFHAMLPRENPVEAAKWYAAQLTGDSQFVYQQGAGPAAFNTRVGKLFGMYGTWPSWMGSLIQQRLKYGTMADKARFVGYTFAAHAAFLNATYLTGINMSKWTGLDFGWAGGPAFDVVKDLSSVVGGEQVSGEPTAERELALSKYGLRDTGGPIFEVKDPRKLIEGTAGLFFPGSYAARDVFEGVEMMQEDPARGALSAAGFQLAKPETY